MAHNEVNNLLNAGLNSIDEPVGILHPVVSGSQQDDYTPSQVETIIGSGSPWCKRINSKPVERNAQHVRSPTPNDLDNEPVADTVKVLRAQ